MELRLEEGLLKTGSYQAEGENREIIMKEDWKDSVTHLARVTVRYGHWGVRPRYKVFLGICG